MNPLDRIFALHRLLQGRRVPLPLADIQQRLECSRATAVRSIGNLRDWFGAPLDYDRERNGYVYANAEGRFELPGMWFTAAELAALLTLETLLEQQPLGFLADALAPFRERLQQALDRQGVGLPDWRKRLKILRAHSRATGPQFRTVAAALAARQRLAIRYAARADSARPGTREVSPQRLTLYRDNWYLDAWCHTADGLRTFAVERIRSAEPLQRKATEVPEERLDRELGSSYGIFSGEPTGTAELLFSAHAARWVADETWHPQQQGELLADGRYRLRLPLNRSEELIKDVLGYGGEVEVIGPPALREQVRSRLAAAAKLYG
ncbi:MAG TPA: WYL domain-containing protein [Solimonas sp.]|nr:WYL domain-containing protein [Solimonas sp.]